MRAAIVVIVMGVSGSGKSTLASRLATALNAHFVEGDDFHPAHNKEKMASGQPLTDEDRQPWLLELRKQINQHVAGGNSSVVLSCSCLRKRYRQVVRTEGAVLVNLDGPFELLNERLENRKGHFMKSGLLKSQFDTLEVPKREEESPLIVVKCEDSTEKQLQDVLDQLQK